MREVHIRNILRKENIISVACGSECEIYAIIDGKKYNVKSVMNSIVINYAKDILFIIDGEDEERVSKMIEEYYKNLKLNKK